MNNKIPYFVVLVPLFILGFFQQESAFTKDDLNEINAINDNQIVLTIAKLNTKLNTKSTTESTQHYNELNAQALESTLKTIITKDNAIDFLETHLNLSKNNSNSAYAGFAISGFEKFPTILKNDFDVLSVYADLLSFTHHFKDASLLLEKLSQSSNHSEFAVIRLLNISMMFGNIKDVRKYCKRTKRFRAIQVPIACSLWLDAMSADTTLQAQTATKRLTDLVKIGELRDEPSSIQSWIYQLLLDLQLQIDETDKINVTLGKILSSNSVDLAPVIQLVDYLILKDRFIEAEQIVNQFDIDQKLLVRRLIISKSVFQIKNKNNKNQPITPTKISKIKLASQLVADYEMLQEPSKYRIISMWFLYMKSNQEKAYYYANKNNSYYQTINDQLLKSKFDQSNPSPTEEQIGDVK